MSRPFFLPLYRYLSRKLNKDILNIVLKFLFGNTRRIFKSGQVYGPEMFITRARNPQEEEEKKEKVIIEELYGENILSTEDFDRFLQYELFESF